MKINRSPYVGLLFFILVIACVARFYGLDRLSLWADELWVVMDSTRGSLWEMLHTIYYQDNHPPAYYFVSRYTQFIFGSSDFAIRLPSAIAGIMLVAATYIAGKKHFSPEAAIIAAALVAGSYQGIYYSQEARPNIFVALFILLAFHYFRALVLEGDRSRKNIVLFWIAAASASYFHYVGLVFCFCLFLVYLCVLAIKRDKNSFKFGLMLFFPLVLLYLPWISGAFHHLISTPVTAWQRPPDINTLKTTFWFLFGPDDIRVVFFQLLALLSLGYLVLMGVSLARKTAAEKEKQSFILILYTFAMIVLPVLVFFLKSRYSQSAYNHRHFLHVIPLMSLLAGYFLSLALNKLDANKKSLVLAAAVFFIIIFQFDANNDRALYTANHFKQEYREAAKAVIDDQAFLDLKTGMIVSSASFFDHYLKRYSSNTRGSDFIYDNAQQISALQDILLAKQASDFYYLESPLIPGANAMVTVEDLRLAEHYQLLCRTKFLRTQVIKFHTNKPMVAVDFAVLPACH